MTASERLAAAQAQMCNTFFALAGAPDSASAMEQADQALWALDTLLTEPSGTTERPVVLHQAG
ncbi:ABC transporter ATP-binding protein [Streptomyces sp. DB-54]